MEPWGTPQLRLPVSEYSFSALTMKDLFDKYDLIDMKQLSLKNQFIQKHYVGYSKYEKPTTGV